MKKSELDRSMAERNPLSERRPVEPVNFYAAPEAPSKDKTEKPPGPAASGRPETEIPAIGDYAKQYERAEDDKRVVSVKMHPWRHEQIKDEAHATGLFEWQVVDIALEMYFRAKKRP